MIRRNLPLLKHLAAAGLVGAAVSACTSLGGEEFQRGYILDEQAVAAVKPGMSADQVLQSLGTPSTVSTVGNRNWYYISQTSRRPVQFLGETVTDQRVTAVYFTANLRVERVALYGIQDGKVFDFISRTTPAGGEEASFVGQIFRGLGGSTFNPFGG
jgi:outer membrane protein assembly factor BamE (lipoprotein component of BamABCDE complex)